MSRTSVKDYWIIQEHQHRFECWTGFLGVFAAPQASLDSRLKSAPDIRKQVIQLLEILKRNIQHSLRSESARAAPQLDGNGALPRLQTSEQIKAAQPPISPATQAALSGINGTIDRLHRLGIAIRKTSTPSLVSRVEKFAEKDNEDHVFFEHIAFLIVKGLYPGIRDSFVRQLAKSISFRRQRLLYQKRYQKKPNTRRQPQLELEMHVEPTQRDEIVQYEPEIAHEEHQTRKLAIKINSAAFGIDSPSGTHPSAIDSRDFPPGFVETVEVASGPPTVTSIARNNPYPPLPKIQAGKKYWQCNWCFRELEVPDEKTQWKHVWKYVYESSDECMTDLLTFTRSHFKVDLEPYVCVSEQCSEQPVYFVSLRSWRKHMDDFHTTEWIQEIHKPTIWYCDLSHEYNEFSSANELREHLMKLHKEELTLDQLNTRARRNVLSVSRASNICPLCAQDVSALDIKSTQITAPLKHRDCRNDATKKPVSEVPEGHNDSDEEDCVSGANAGPSMRVSSALLEGLQDHVNYIKLATHIAGHLKSLAFTSLRYFEDEGSSVESQNAAFGAGPEDLSSHGWDGDRYFDLDSSLSFEDIPPGQGDPVNGQHCLDLDRSLYFEDAPPDQRGPVNETVGTSIEPPHETYTDTRVRLSRHEYTVGWLCALQLAELVTATEMLDVRHTACDLSSDDDNLYIYGSINGHNVVIAGLLSGIPWKNSTLRLMQPLSWSFPNMKIHLSVGVGSGIPRNPTPKNPEEDIHLGDVVIGWSKRAGVTSVVQYDLRRQEDEDKLLGILEKPDRNLLNALTLLMANHFEGETNFSEHLKRSKFSHPGLKNDRLYESAYTHIGGGNTCSTCEPSRVVDRPKRNTTDLVFHQGTILSGDSVIKSADARDQLAKPYNAICIESEAAGLMDEKNCLVVRGICDYADTHKNNLWQPYAAATAAAFARELLYTIMPLSVLAEDGLDKQNEYHIPIDMCLLYKRNPHFKGREQELAKIHKIFWSSNSHSEPNRRVISLCGLGGSGKTHVALEYAYRYATEYSAIFWIDAATGAKLQHSVNKAITCIIYAIIANTTANIKGNSNQTYLRIAHSLGFSTREITSKKALMKAVTKSPIECLRRWLSQERNDKWLLILDDPGKADIDLDMLLPTGDAGHVLITTRTSNSYQSRTDIEIGSLEQSEAVELMLKTSGINITPEDLSRTNGLEYRSALEIIGVVRSLPFLITFIGGYLRTTGTSLELYAKNLDEKLWGLFEGFDAVLDISFCNLSQEAKHLINLFSLLGKEDIPYKLIEAGKKIVDWMKAENAINKALEELLSFSFLRRNENGTYYLNALVHQWVREHMENPIMDSLLVVDIVTSTFAFGDERRKSQSLYELGILPHIERCFEIFFDYMAPKSGPLNDVTKKVAYDLARVYTYLGNIQKSTALYERSLEGIDAQPSSLDLKMMDALGVNLGLQGKYEEALGWCEQSLVGMKSQDIDSEDSPESLLVVSHIATIYKAKGNFSEAITRYRWVLAQQEKKLGPFAPSTLETRRQLGGVLTDSKTVGGNSVLNTQSH
ncbi:hypothetical protein TWF694_005359 [Orbilia ellipsospora]|uniref:NB-ARC domain-containing protein n=1 Tax=Orbilia ellipsospora TaxID=2528407 RepID=A0AAV9WT70_9PEZI